MTSIASNSFTTVVNFHLKLITEEALFKIWPEQFYRISGKKKVVKHMKNSIIISKCYSIFPLKHQQKPFVNFCGQYSYVLLQPKPMFFHIFLHHTRLWNIRSDRIFNFWNFCFTYCSHLFHFTHNFRFLNTSLVHIHIFYLLLPYYRL